MQNTPSAYKSTVLAQAALLNNPLKSFESSPINGKIKANSHELQMPNISTVPSLNTSNNQPLRSDFGMPLKQLVELFARKAKSVYEHVLISERGEGVLTKAIQYNIPFDQHNIDWLDLMDEVNEYECQNYIRSSYYAAV
jgi:hypothetical protein